MTTTRQLRADEPALVVAIQNLLAEGRTTDALGAYYMTAACEHAPVMQPGWAIVTVEPGLQLHLCSDCGRPTNRDTLMPERPYEQGDVAYWCSMLWVIQHRPGPTGAVVLRPLDSDDTVTVHVLQLNLEE